MSRRDALLGAALAVVAETGLKGLTHRAVDARAGLPSGSAANVFRNRDHLVRGVLDELEVRDRELWEAGSAELPDTADGLARHLAEWAIGLTTEPNAALTRVRMTMALSYPEEVRPGHLRLLDLLRTVPGARGVRTDRAMAIAALLDGFLLHAVSVAPERAADRDALEHALRVLLAG